MNKNIQLSLKTAALMALVAAAVSFLPVTPANAASIYENFDSYTWNTQPVVAPNGNAQIVTGAANNWSEIWWQDSGSTPTGYVNGWTYPPFGSSGGNYLRMTSTGVGNFVLFNTGAALQSGASTISGDVYQSLSGNWGYRGLVFNLQATTAGQTFYYAGINALGNGNIGLTIRKASNSTGGFSNNTASPSGWNNVFAQNVDTGLVWAPTDLANVARLTINMSAPGVFSVNVAQWNVGNPGSLGGNFTSSTINDSGSALTGGYVGFGTDQWDNIGFNNLSVTTVPEPSTWAMMLGGLGTLALLRRRRA
jgi:hypothetical protein